ncbi:MAG TPA: hypothetical protein PLT11_09200, partial [Elusimicrobiota bacterium]|nr:hypothetical protein [Elusimicrobiota bacterium]
RLTESTGAVVSGLDGIGSVRRGELVIRGGRRGREIRVPLVFYSTSRPPAEALRDLLGPPREADDPRLRLQRLRYFGPASEWSGLFDEYRRVLRLGRKGRELSAALARAEEGLGAFREPAQPLDGEAAGRAAERLARPVSAPNPTVATAGDLRERPDAMDDLLGAVREGLRLDPAMPLENLPAPFLGALDRWNARGEYLRAPRSGNVELVRQKIRLLSFVHLPSGKPLPVRLEWRAGLGLVLWAGDELFFDLHRHRERVLAGAPGMYSPQAASTIATLADTLAVQAKRQRLNALLGALLNADRPDRNLLREIDALSETGVPLPVSTMGEDRMLFTTPRSGRPLVIQTDALSGEAQTVRPRWLPGWGPVILVETEQGVLAYGLERYRGAPEKKGRVNADYLDAFASVPEADRELPRRLAFAGAVFDFARRDPASVSAEEAAATVGALQRAPVVFNVPSSGTLPLRYPRAAAGESAARKQVLFLERATPGPNRATFEFDGTAGVRFSLTPASGGDAVWYAPEVLRDGRRMAYLRPTTEKGLEWRRRRAVADRWRELAAEALAPPFLWALREPDAFAEKRKAFNGLGAVLRTNAAGELSFDFPDGPGGVVEIHSTKDALAPNADHRVTLEWVWGAGLLMFVEPADGGPVSVFGFGGVRRARPG